MNFVSYGFAILLAVGLMGVDIYLLLELFKQPGVTWLIVALIWISAFFNLAGIALIVAMIDLIGMT